MSGAAKHLGMPTTSARLILHTWKEEGRVFKKLTSTQKRQKFEQIKLNLIQRRKDLKQKREGLPSTPTVKQENEAALVKYEEEQQELR